MTEDEQTPSWKAYQEEAAEFFRSLGQEASTDITVRGARTTHDIDVLVTLDVGGIKIRWLIECKHWKSRVTKLHVLALREIVSDIGADRGIILCEAGFQSGAIEAASLTNVQVTSLAALSASSQDAIYSAKLRDLFDRVEICNVKYWDIPKDTRIKKGLRFGVYDDEDNMYSGARIIELSEKLISQALRSRYPIAPDQIHRLFCPALPEILNSAKDVFETIAPLIDELEIKLSNV